MRIAGRDRLDAFCKSHPDARKWVGTWLHETELVKWSTPQDVKGRYASASFLHGNVVILNVKGNAYRLELSVAYKTGIVTVLWVGTHAEYDERNRQRKS